MYFNGTAITWRDNLSVYSIVNNQKDTKSTKNP